MKHLKGLFVAVAALVLTFVFSSTAFAAGTGSITITPPADVDKDATITYTIYKVFDANGDGTGIRYTLVDGKTQAPAGFTVDAAGNVKYTGSGNDGELTDEDIAAIAAYVAGDSPAATVSSTGGAAAVATNLPNGYYYITTSTGTVVTINSTNPDATVDDKNTVPTVDKKITGASSYDADGKKALAQVGTSVTYTATITVGQGATNYVFKDTMGAGLSYNNDLAVAGATAGTGYTVSVAGDTITVRFENDYVTSGISQIVVTYTATVTSDALQDNPAKNTATISYGNNSQFTSQPSQTEVYNAKFTVTKQDGNQQPLAGAGFVVANADGKYYKLENNVVSWVDTIDDATEYTSGSDGAVPAFTGLANGTYTLIEKTVPAGYNKAADSTFTVAANNYTAGNLSQAATVTNETGATLPSTGGMGTTLLYAVGIVLVVGAAGILIRNKRGIKA